MDHQAGVGDALIAVLDHHRPHELHQTLAEPGPQRFDRHGFFGQDLENQGGDGVAAERTGARKQLVEHHTEGEDVGAAVELFAADLLGRHVLRAADHRAGAGQLDGLVLQFGDAKVGDFGFPFGAEQDVARFDVAVDDVAMPGVVERGGGFPHHPQHFAQGHFRGLPGAFQEVLAGHEFEGQVEQAGGFARVVEGDDVGVLESAGGAGFAQQAAAAIGDVFVVAADDPHGFDRHQAIDVRVVGEVDVAHRSGAERFLDLVAADPGRIRFYAQRSDRGERAGLLAPRV